jgi:hypothetical protein
MFKTIQIIRYLQANGYTKSEIFTELSEIVDNYHSDIFELNDRDCDQVTRIFNNDDLLAKSF